MNKDKAKVMVCMKEEQKRGAYVLKISNGKDKS